MDGSEDDLINSLFGDDISELNSSTNNIFDNNPGLAPLADNGCNAPAGAPSVAACVQTHGLLASSLALDAGSNPNSLSSDERGTGFPRVLNGVIDMGAFEGFLVNAPAEAIPTLNAWLLGLLSIILGFVVWMRGGFRFSKGG